MDRRNEFQVTIDVSWWQSGMAYLASKAVLLPPHLPACLHNWSISVVLRHSQVHFLFLYYQLDGTSFW